MTAKFRANCVSCCQHIVAGNSTIKTSWMGWIHEDCEAGVFIHFAMLIQRLQACFDMEHMPAAAHLYTTVVELEEYVENCEASESDGDELEFPDIAQMLQLA